jgi:hypothetical protein
MGGGGVIAPFLSSALDGAEWLASRPGHFTLQGKTTHPPGTNWIRGWAGPFGRCGKEKNILPLEGIKPRFLGGLALDPVAIPTELSIFKTPVPTYQ